jgi:hypothetical protein
MANSVVYLDTFGHIVVAWIWLQQVIAAHDCAGDFYDAKRQAALLLPLRAAKDGAAIGPTREPRPLRWRCATAGSDGRTYKWRQFLWNQRTLANAPFKQFRKDGPCRSGPVSGSWSEWCSDPARPAARGAQSPR